MKMKLFCNFVICVWAACVFSQVLVPRTPVGVPPLTSNILQFYLAVDDLANPRVPGRMLVDSNIAPSGLKLMTVPILADADFVAWDARSNTFDITPQAALKLFSCCKDRTVRFVVVALGEPIYLGSFDTEISEVIPGNPVIYTRTIPYAVRWTSLSSLNSMTGWRGPGVGHPNWEDVEQIHQLLATTNNATNIVTLRIDAGMFPRDGLPNNTDKLNDKRISAAVAKLFPETNKAGEPQK